MSQANEPGTDIVRSNTVWAALTSGNADLAIGSRLALRYPPDIAPFAAITEESPEAYEQLKGIMSDGDSVATFLPEEMQPPACFRVDLSAPIVQMQAQRRPIERPSTVEIVQLGDKDVPEMLDLTELTKPGPFSARTYLLGHYIGIRIGGRLAAMAGERMRFRDRVEISAVCVHPDFRRLGYAETLINALMSRLAEQDKTPILHAFNGNVNAIALYERLGFTVVQQLHVTRLTLVA